VKCLTHNVVNTKHDSLSSGDRDRLCLCLGDSESTVSTRFNSLTNIGINVTRKVSTKTKKTLYQICDSRLVIGLVSTSVLTQPWKKHQSELKNIEVPKGLDKESLNTSIFFKTEYRESKKNQQESISILIDVYQLFYWDSQA
jgi:hypothetical protein